MSGLATPSTHTTRAHQGSGPGYRRSAARAFIAVVVAALVAAGLALFVPSAAQAYNGGASKTTPIALPIEPPQSFTGDNTGLTTPASGTPPGHTCTSASAQCWYNVTYWSWTPTTTGKVAIRATSISPAGWDNTLEVWSGASAGTFVTENDDSYGLDAQVTFNYTSGTTYVIGMGGFQPSYRGTVDLKFLISVPTVPGTLGSVVATGGDASANVTWTDPSANTLSVTSYSIYTYVNGVLQPGVNSVTGTPPVRTYNRTGLTNGTTYTFKVLGTNAVGSSALSSPSNAVTPSAIINPPGIPNISSASAGSGSVTVSVLPGAGGTPTHYDVTASPGGGTCIVTSPATSCAVTGLTNGTSYNFTATATNTAGTSADSAVTSVVIPGPPATPVINTTVAGNALVTVGVGPGVGGGTIDSYTVFASPGPSQCTIFVPATTCLVTGLTNGTSYTFTAKAQNGAGLSSASAASGSVTPSASAPGIPPAPTAVAHDGSATITVAAGVGGAPDSQTVTATPGGATCTVSAAAGSCLMTGLTNGTQYVFTTVATNGSGTSGASAPSTGTTPLSTIPGTPPAPTAVPRNGGATVTVAAGSGTAPTSYTVIASPGGATCTVTGAAGSCLVPGLTNGTAYTFTTTATNASGTSAASSDSGSVTPLSTIPGPPLTPTAVKHNGSATVTVAAGSGGTPTSYTVTASPGGATCAVTGAAGSCLVPGLTNGTAYTFTATATNADGTSTSSPASAPVTPLASIPGTPGTPTGVPGNGGITVTVPTGSPAPTTTTVTANPGGATCVITFPATSCYVPGLANGTAYTFTAVGTNGSGSSDTSTASTPVTPLSTIPGPPLTPTAVKHN
ncbi:MAG: fibronectin type III domain-containing protein, partial [Actinomycetes bacterium]